MMAPYLNMKHSRPWWTELDLEPTTSSSYRVHTLDVVLQPELDTAPSNIITKNGLSTTLIIIPTIDLSQLTTGRFKPQRGQTNSCRVGSLKFGLDHGVNFL